mmetsp:Transcript_41466/g.127852  ORF Transcript_41466/g.127852 Transcript_41466/m.127852 type:complete len:306 (-) Transcript_41466:52-969(-)
MHVERQPGSAWHGKRRGSGNCLKQGPSTAGPSARASGEDAGWCAADAQREQPQTRTARWLSAAGLLRRASSHLAAAATPSKPASGGATASEMSRPLAASGGVDGGGSGGSGTADGTADGELHAWLHARGFAFTTDCAVAGSAAVVEDEQHDRRLCVCLDGGAAASLAEWSESIKEGRALASAGWAFHRIWRSSWLVHRARCEADLASALEAAGIRPSVSAPSGGGGTRPKQPPHHLEDALSGGAGAASSSAAGGTSGLSGRKRKGGSAVAAAAAEEEEEEEVEEEGGRAEAEPAATKQAGAKKRR